MADNFFGITDLGRERQNNEDTFVAGKASNNFIVAAVIDGVGGYSGGEIAAEITRETILKRLDRPSGEIIPLMLDVLNAANDKIWQERQTVKEHNSMACVVTLAVIDVAANQFYYAHVGDTRLYLFRDGSLIKISHDQSFVGFLEDSGRLSEKDAMRHPKRNEIDKALGFKNTFKSNSDDIETGQSPFLPGDLLLLCSDGLTDVVDKDTITQILANNSSLKTTGSRLIDAANDGGGKDNITVVLVRNDKPQQQHVATRPVDNASVNEPVKTVRKQATAAVKPQATYKPAAKTNKGLVSFLLLLVVGLALFCAWQYIHYNGAVVAVNKDIDTTVTKPRSPLEVKLQNAIDHNKGKILVLNDTAYKGPIVITQSIIINRDSLYLKAKGNIIFKSDSGFTGTAFTFSGKTKSVVLDSLSFQDFNVAVAGINQVLAIKNLRFKNCKTPVQNSFDFKANKYVSGSFPTALFKTDSLPKTK